MQSGGLRLNEFNSTINPALAPPKGLAVWAGCPDKLTTWPPLCHGARPAEGWQPVSMEAHGRAATSGTRDLDGRWPGSGVQILTRGGMCRRLKWLTTIGPGLAVRPAQQCAGLGRGAS